MKSFNELYDELKKYPLIETSYAYTPNEMDDPERVMAYEFRVESISREMAEQELVKQITEKIGDGSQFNIWIRLMPYVRQGIDMEYIGRARIAFFPKKVEA